MADSIPPPDDNATTDLVPQAEWQDCYPRPWWLAIIRFLLSVAGFSGPLYVLLFVQALIQHTLHTRDRNLLSVPSMVEVVLLTAGGVWAIRDTVREMIAEDRRRKAERRVPFEVWAERSFRADLAKARAKGDRRAEGIALGGIGRWLNAQERYAEAEPYLTQALALARAVGDRFHEEHFLFRLSKCTFERGDLEATEALCREALAVALTLTRESLPSVHPKDTYVLDEVANAYEEVGRYFVMQGDLRLEGCRMLAEAEARYRELARLHEVAAQAHRPGSHRWDSETTLRQRALLLAQDMHDLQQQYGGDGAGDGG